MARDDTKHYSRIDIAAMKARGEVRATLADAPEIELDEAFWEKARIVEARPRRKASVHLRLEDAGARGMRERPRKRTCQRDLP